MQIDIAPLPEISCESINSRLQAIWSLLIENRKYGSFCPTRYPNSFGIVVEWDLRDKLKVIKIRATIQLAHYQISVDHESNIISIRLSTSAGAILVFSNRPTQVHQRGKVAKEAVVEASEWFQPPERVKKLTIGADSMRQAENALDLIIRNLEKCFKQPNSGKAA